jgi:hypothetical protein
MKNIFIIISLLITYEVHSSDTQNMFYGVFTTENMIGKCKAKDPKPVSSVVWFSNTESKPSELAKFIEKESGRLQYIATKKGSNAIVAYKEMIVFDKNWGAVVTFSGVGVTLECH